MDTGSRDEACFANAFPQLKIDETIKVELPLSNKFEMQHISVERVVLMLLVRRSSLPAGVITLIVGKYVDWHLLRFVTMIMVK